MFLIRSQWSASRRLCGWNADERNCSASLEASLESRKNSAWLPLPCMHSRQQLIGSATDYEFGQNRFVVDWVKSLWTVKKCNDCIFTFIHHTLSEVTRRLVGFERFPTSASIKARCFGISGFRKRRFSLKRSSFAAGIDLRFISAMLRWKTGEIWTFDKI